jgi:hypothetical protein
MMLGSLPDGTVMLVGEALSVGEVEQHLKEAMEVPSSLLGELVPVYPVPGHPPMRLDAGFVEFVSPLFLRSSSFADFLILLSNPECQNLAVGARFLGFRSAIAKGRGSENDEPPLGQAREAKRRTSRRKRRQRGNGSGIGERTSMMTMMIARRKRGSATSHSSTGTRWHMMMRMRWRAVVHLHN